MKKLNKSHLLNGLKITLNLSLMILGLTSCYKPKEKKEAQLYNINLTYCFDSLPENRNFRFSARDISKDSMYLFFENGYLNDTIEVIVNNSILFDGTMVTDNNIGAAKKLNAGLLNDINEIKIVVNNGPIILVNRFPTNMATLNFFERIEIDITFIQKPNMYY